MVRASSACDLVLARLYHVLSLRTGLGLGRDGTGLLRGRELLLADASPDTEVLHGSVAPRERGKPVKRLTLLSLPHYRAGCWT